MNLFFFIVYATRDEGDVSVVVSAKIIASRKREKERSEGQWKTNIAEVSKSVLW